MPRCEDFPCCGHEAGCCPTYSESGEQLDMVCTCGARLPVNSRYSICDSCMDACGDDGDDRYEPEDHFRDDVEADADVLANAGWGTDEDYGYYGEREDYGDWGYEGMWEE